MFGMRWKIFSLSFFLPFVFVFSTPLFSSHPTAEKNFGGGEEREKSEGDGGKDFLGGLGRVVRELKRGIEDFREGEAFRKTDVRGEGEKGEGEKGEGQKGGGEKSFTTVGEGSRVFVIRVEGAISPPVADFIEESLDRAQKGGAELFIILLDTPGGLDPAMRRIVKAIESSYVPVCVFVWPVGARAASAGTFITISAHIAAMSPGTSIGAASPVLMGGKEMNKTLKKKIENDAVAYIRALAKRHGRNAEWLEKAVRNAETLTAEEALKKNVIDVVAESIPDLIRKIKGMKVKTPAGEIVIDINQYEIVRIEPNIKHRILKVISDPNVAYILMMIGIWGIFFELANPGAIFPGVVGAICLILGLYSLQALPVNWAGLLLILLSIVLFLLEIKVASGGILAILGVGSMILGSLMLFRSPEPFLRASWRVILSTTAATSAFFIFVAYKGIRAQFRRSVVGFEGLLGKTAEVFSDFRDGKGKVFVSGEIWDAQTTDKKDVKKGELVEVVGHDGMILIVRKRESGAK